jgi:D-amino peptidase
MKILISVDAEGLGWTVSGSQTLSEGSDYQIFREIYTEQVNAVIDGAIKGGASEIYINDAHGSSKNILYKNLHKKARLIIGDPKPNSMMEGIEFADKVFLLGYHSKAGTVKGVLNHTYSSNVHRLFVNGEEFGEIALSTSVAGKFGKSVTFFAGDLAAVNEAKKYINNAEFVVMKEGISRYSAITYSLDQLKDVLTEAARNAVSKDGTVYSIKEPANIKIEFLNSGMADYCLLVPGVRRIDGYTVEFEAKVIIEGYRMFRLMVKLSSSEHGGY